MRHCFFESCVYKLDKFRHCQGTYVTILEYVYQPGSLKQCLTKGFTCCRNSKTSGKTHHQAVGEVDWTPYLQHFRELLQVSGVLFMPIICEFNPWTIIWHPLQTTGIIVFSYSVIRKHLDSISLKLMIPTMSSKWWTNYLDMLRERLRVSVIPTRAWTYEF